MIGLARRCRSDGTALLFAACLSIGFASTTRARSLPVQLRHKPAFPLFGIVGLAGDHFLVWEGSGQMQIGTSAGEWTGVFRVPLSPVTDVVADAQGILVGGALDPGPSAALLVNQAGQELGRWRLGHQLSEVRVDAGARFATTWGGVVPLLAGGAVGAPRPFVGADASPHGSPPHVLRDELSVMVTCRHRDWSKATSAPGRCWKTGPAGWRIEGDFNDLIACGDWLVAIEGDRHMRLVGYSLASGTPAFRIDEPVMPAITCASPGVLLVGDRRLTMFRLPNPRPIWTAKPNRGRIILIAATEHAIAFSETATGGVVIVPRPTSSELR